MAKASKAARAETKTSHDERLEKYNAVVADAELGGIQLIKLDFDVSPEYYGDGSEIELGYIVRPESSEYDDEAGIAACIISFQVEAIRDDVALLQCNATYTVMYRIGEKRDEEAVKAFIERLGVFACYPYFRGVFANLDWAANTRLPPLPVHKEEVKRKRKPKKASFKSSQPDSE